MICPVDLNDLSINHCHMAAMLVSHLTSPSLSPPACCLWRFVERQIRRDSSVRYPPTEEDTKTLLTYFTFVYRLYHLRAPREERDVCLLYDGMPGQEGCCTEIVSL